MGYTLYFHYETCLNERFLSSLLNTYTNSLASKEIHGCKNKLSTCLENTFHHYSVNEKTPKGTDSACILVKELHTYGTQ